MPQTQVLCAQSESYDQRTQTHADTHKQKRSRRVVVDKIEQPYRKKDTAKTYPVFSCKKVLYFF